MLSGRAAYLYQVSIIFFAFSLMLNLQPITVSSLYFMIFMTFYVVAASRRLGKFSKRSFVAILTANPNPAVTGHEVRVRAVLAIRDGKLPLELRLDVEDLIILNGSNSWGGVLKRGEEASIELTVTSHLSGLRSVGPLRVAVRDPLGILVKEIEVHPSIPILFLKSGRLIIQPMTYSASRHPSPGLSKNPFTGMEYEYRVSFPSPHTSQARKIDWRRTARAPQDEVYVKEFDKLRRADIAICIGTGLEVELPDGRFAEADALQQTLQIILPYLKEGSKVWIMKYVEDKGYVAASIRYGLYGLKLVRAEEPSATSLIIYLTRFADEGEVDLLKRVISSKPMNVKLILIDLGRELTKYSAQEKLIGLADLELKRLRMIADGIGLSYSITGLDDLQNTLRRVLSFERRI